MALTDPALHARWWAAGDVRAVVGHRVELDVGPWDAGGDEAGWPRVLTRLETALAA